MFKIVTAVAIYMVFVTCLIVGIDAAKADTIVRTYTKSMGDKVYYCRDYRNDQGNIRTVCKE